MTVAQLLSLGHPSTTICLLPRRTYSISTLVGQPNSGTTLNPRKIWSTITTRPMLHILSTPTPVSSLPNSVLSEQCRPLRGELTAVIPFASMSTRFWQTEARQVHLSRLAISNRERRKLMITSLTGTCGPSQTLSMIGLTKAVGQHPKFNTCVMTSSN